MNKVEGKISLHSLLALKFWLYSNKLFVTLRKQQHLLIPQLDSPQNDAWEMSAEIPYWWIITPQVWVVLLIGWEFASAIKSEATEALSRSG